MPQQQDWWAFDKLVIDVKDMNRRLERIEAGGGAWIQVDSTTIKYPGKLAISRSAGGQTTAEHALVNQFRYTLEAGDSGLNASITYDISGVSTQQTLVRFFRLTDTSGRAALEVLAATQSNTINCSIAGNTNTYLNRFNGSVGIGTASPDEKLHCNDNILADGALMAGGDDTAKMKMKSLTLSHGSVAQLPHVSGNGAGTAAWVFIVDKSNNHAIYVLRGSNNSALEVTDVLGVYTPTSGNGGTTNIYWSAGNSRYEIENLRGASNDYVIWFFTN